MIATPILPMHAIAVLLSCWLCVSPAHYTKEIAEAAVKRNAAQVGSRLAFAPPAGAEDRADHISLAALRLRDAAGERAARRPRRGLFSFGPVGVTMAANGRSRAGGYPSSVHQRAA